MKLEKGSKNTIVSLLAQIITISVGVIIPRLVLVNLGSEANGLLSSIGNILTYLSLLEAGIGLASLQALYQPVGQNDRKKVNEIMSATDHYYKQTGTYYAIALGLLSIVYTLYVKTEIPRLTVFLVVILAGIPSIVNYLFQGKLRIFLMAEGKNYIITLVATTFGVLTSVLKAVLLLCGGGIIAIQILGFSLSLLQMLVYVLYFKKNYSWLDFKAKPDLEAVSQKKAVLVHQISELIFNHVDVLLLTIFADLKVVSVYSMYAMIYGMVKSVAVSFSEGYNYALGQNYHNKERFLVLFDVYEVFNMCITFSFFCIGFNLMIPFLKLYTRGITDISYIDNKVNILFVLYYLLQNARKSSASVISIAQKFEETKWWSLAEAAVNLISSVILVYFYGIYGVLLGSAIALIFRTFEMIWFSAKLLDRSPLITVRRWLVNLILFILISLVIQYISGSYKNYFELTVHGIVCSIITVSAYFFASFLFYRKQFKYVVRFLKRKWGKQKNEIGEDDRHND